MGAIMIANGNPYSKFKIYKFYFVNKFETHSCILKECINQRIRVGEPFFRTVNQQGSFSFRQNAYRTHHSHIRSDIPSYRKTQAPLFSLPE